ncbi:hypothetical protein ACUR5C_03980 [Aliikangiella sp. IMCC44653]
MKKLIKSALLISAAASFSFSAMASEKGITEADIKAAPELQQANEMQMSSAATGIKCLVDTPRWDRWGSPNCFSVGSARTTTAYFQITNPPANYTIYWSHEGCNSGSATCNLPIRTYQTLVLSATVLDHSNNTFTQVESRAHYEGMD